MLNKIWAEAVLAIGDLTMWKKSQGETDPPELMIRITDQLKPSFDVKQIPLKIEGKLAFLLYLKTVVDGTRLQDVIIKPFFEMSSDKHFEAYINSLPDKVELPAQEDNLLFSLTLGHVLVAIQDCFFLLDLRKVNSDIVLPTSLEATVHGPQLALSEILNTNVNIIRQRYHKPSLKVESIELDDITHKPIAILYDEDVVKIEVLKAIKEKLDQLDVPLIQSSGDLLLHLNDKKFSLFPTMILTERPDRIAYNLAAGKVVLMVDGTPLALLAPVIFFDFMVSTEDNYHSFWIVKFSLILRYFGLFTCIILPGLYVALISYNPDFFRTELALTVAGSRIGVPYPSYIEVIFMLIFMELLTEASIRPPKVISAAATTVGGLILGTAATEASLVSNIMIMLIAAVAISTFVIPINEMSFAVRVIRVLFLLFAALFGMAGLTAAFIGMIMYLTNIESFGEPYLRFYWKAKKSELKGQKG